MKNLLYSGWIFISFFPGCTHLKTTFDMNFAASLGGSSAGAVSLIQWPDTGQTLCYDTNDGTTIACTGAGGSFPNQDGDFANIPSSRSYTVPTQHPTYTSDYTTMDNTTGLLWTSCSDGQTGASCSGSGSHNDRPTAIAICAALNSANSGAGYAGQKNWRLPSKTELESLMDSGISGLNINITAFPNTEAYRYWSSSDAGSNGFYVDFSITSSTVGVTTDGENVRCVANSATATIGPLTDLGDGTIKDTKTNLIWQKCSMGVSGASCGTGGPLQDTWANSLTFCKNLVLAGRSWRLPSINELRSIVDETQPTFPYIPVSYFPNTAAFGYWSSTTDPATNSVALGADFGDASTGQQGAKIINTGPTARCVATGP